MSKRRKDRGFRLDDEQGQRHMPKKERSHLAREYMETNRAELADEVSRRLMPWAAFAARTSG